MTRNSSFALQGSTLKSSFPDLFLTYFQNVSANHSSRCCVLYSALFVTATLALSHVAAPVAFVTALLLTSVAALGRGTLGFLVGPASLLEL